MKKIVLLLSLIMCISCENVFRNELNELHNEIDELRELIVEVNTNIEALQMIVNALQNNDFVTGVTPIIENGVEVGYTIAFSKSGTAVIYHGKNGYTPQIGVRQDSDGLFYWTLDGEWLLDEHGNKIRANGLDGQDGAPGADGEPGADGTPGQDGEQGEDGITPQLKIEQGWWYISYDNGQSWTQLGKATGDDGQQGESGANGDSIFADIDCSNEDYIILTLSNGQVIQIPTWSAFSALQEECRRMNDNIEALQAILNALQENDYVKSVTPVRNENGEGIGYIITFSKGSSVTIYHGKDGAPGADGQPGQDGRPGEDGQDGADGYTPVISVKKDTDGQWYWTVDGQWLKDENGQKVPASGSRGENGTPGQDGQPGADGRPGEDGRDGITPQLKIEDGYWYVSYDEGQSWTKLGAATGEQGPQGEQGVPGVGGDSMFTNLDYSNKDYITLTLSNGQTIKLPTWSAFEALKEECRKANANIEALQALLEALQNNDYVTGVTPIYEGGKEIGYIITFSKGSNVTIYHGKDGEPGADGQPGQDGRPGEDGQDGADGYTPVISVKKDTDGQWYWTVDGQWLKDENGQKVPASGSRGENGTPGQDGQPGADGRPGEDGRDGITPQLKIEDGYWYVSYDEGQSWTKLGKATGEQGPQGEQGVPGVGGDSMFTNLDYSNKDYITLTLSNGQTIKLPTWGAFEALKEECRKANANIEALQKIINALQDNDFVESITPIYEGAEVVGYRIKFSKSGEITIFHGEDGKDGEDGRPGQDGKPGEDGQDGEDGHTPVISVKKDTDGQWYWTVDGQWLKDENGQKVPASGKDGADGQPGADGKPGQDGQPGQDGKPGADGKDGITPQLKIEDGWWYISYNNGQTWTKLDKAKGEDGDSFFQKVENTEEGVILTLADGEVIIIPHYEPSIVAQIGNLIYIPGSENGSAVAYYKEEYNNEKTNAYVDLSFNITPKSIISDLTANWNKILKAKARYTGSANNALNLSILSFKSNSNAGEITLTVSLDKMSNDFFDGNASACIAICFEDGTYEVHSEYINLRAPEKKFKHIIYYITTDGRAISNPSVSPAKILSNTYKDGQGVIALDREITELPSLFWSNKTTLQSITIPEGIFKIGDSAFYGCSALTEIKFPESVQEIGGRAFGSCSALTTVSLPDKLKLIGDHAFFNCSALGSITFPKSLETIETHAFYACSSLRSAYMNEGLKTIGANAFKNCSSLTSADLKEGLKSIGERAFIDCSSLRSINFPKSLETIGSGAFEYCSSLTSADMKEGLKSIGEDAFWDCDNLVSITIPSTVSEIPSHAFWSCEKLTSVEIPKGVKYIGEYAFWHCQSLTKLHISGTVTEIGKEAFGACYLLSKITLDEGVQIIGESAFAGSRGLREVTIPSTVKRIESNAFNDIFNSLTVHLLSTPPIDLGANAFYKSSGLKIYVPSEFLEDYKTYHPEYEKYYLEENLQ